MQKRSFGDEVLRPRALTRRARGWRPRVRGLRPLRGSLGRPLLTVHAPPLRLGRIVRPAAAYRLVLRIRGPRVVLRERFSRLTTREFMRALGVPASARVQDVHELHVHTSTRPPVGSPGMTPTATALRSVTQTVARETRRIERLHVQTVRERIRVEHAPERSRAAAPVQRRSVAARTRAPVRLAPPAEAVPTAHPSQPPTAASGPIGLVVAAGPALPTPTPLAAPSRSPSVEEIAERVLRLIERRARAQRERLGRL
jgi:hypothetical protein